MTLNASEWLKRLVRKGYSQEASRWENPQPGPYPMGNETK